MFLYSNPEKADGRISVLGEFVKIDGQYVVLRIPKGTVKVQPKGFDSYKTKYVLVTGNMENGVLVEEHVQPMENDFDYNQFSRLAKQLQTHQEIF